jgi:hypothetical protein
VYTFDDHDTGRNNANGMDDSVQEANHAYRATVPHYPIAAQSADDKGIWQSWRVGHVLFVLTDSRSYLLTENTDADKGEN